MSSQTCSLRWTSYEYDNAGEATPSRMAGSSGGQKSPEKEKDAAATCVVYIRSYFEACMLSPCNCLGCITTDYIYVACARRKASNPRVYDQETTLLVWHIPMKGWLWRLVKVCRSETLKELAFAENSQYCAYEYRSGTH